jgi:undecaprenyl-diphosphatase
MFELAKFISLLGDTEFMMILLILVSISLVYFKFYKEALIVAGSTILPAGTTYILKKLFQAPRPLDALVLETGYRFPSGHATAAGFIFALVTYFAFSKLKSKKLKYLIFAIAFIWLIAICWARLYLGVHILIDVIVGAMIGIGMTALCVSFVSKYFTK